MFLFPQKTYRYEANKLLLRHILFVDDLKMVEYLPDEHLKKPAMPDHFLRKITHVLI